MTVIARMHLHETGDVRCLAGHSIDEASVYVLRRSGDAYELHQVPIASRPPSTLPSHSYTLHQVPISEAEATIRAFLSADQSTAMELCRAILMTIDAPIRKPKRRKAK